MLHSLSPDLGRETRGTHQPHGNICISRKFTAGRKFMDSYVKRRVKNNYALRVIRSKPKEVGETWPTNPQELRTLRYAPSSMIFAMTMYIYANKVGIISSTKENFGIIIESQEFNQNMGHLFEALWQISTSV